MNPSDALALMRIRPGQYVRYHGSMQELRGFVYRVSSIDMSGRLRLKSDTAALPNLKHVHPTSVTIVVQEALTA